MGWARTNIICGTVWLASANTSLAISVLIGTAFIISALVISYIELKK